jgi:hydroxypyruvate isomerase
MPRFSANLTFLWPDRPVIERVAAAARAGFRRAEILFVHDQDPAALERALRDHGLSLDLFDPRPGDWSKGERGLLSVPGREAEFADSVREAIENARRFGTRKINALAGIPPPGTPHERAFETAVANLSAAAPLVEAAGLQILVEAINNVDMPGYFASTVDLAALIVQAADSPVVRLQLDQYHVGMAGHDARAALRRYQPLVAHVQIADVPGRHEPGTGGQPIAAFLADLDALGYPGCVGLEYRPLADTDAGLSWLPQSARG